MSEEIPQIRVLNSVPSEGERSFSDRRAQVEAVTLAFMVVVPTVLAIVFLVVEGLSYLADKVLK